MGGIHVKFEVTPQEFLDELTDAAYRVALEHGIGTSFLEMELDLEKSMKRVISRLMQFSPACGAEECKKREHTDLLSLEVLEPALLDTKPLI